MDLLEYQGKQLFARHGIPVPTGIPARSVDEPRAQVIGMIGHQAWSAFVTSRDERVRIISVRRARDEEKARYNSR